LLSAAVAAGPVDDLLSPAQRAWLATHPKLTVGFPSSQPPAVVEEIDGSPAGVFIDFLDLLNRRLGTSIRVELDTWPRLVERAERREIDMLGLTFPLATHREHFVFTAPFFETYYYIYARSDLADPPRDLASLSGKRVGYVAATRMVEEMLAARGGIELVALPSQEALATALMVSQVDAVLGSISLEYWRHQHTQTGFRVTGMVPEMGGELVMSVRKDWPELTAILNAGLATITTAERQAIIARWLGGELPRPLAAKASLSAEERAWLASQPSVRVGIDPAWAPVSFVDERDAPQGIAVAYLRRLEAQLGVRLELITTPSWSAAKRQFATGRLDLLPAIATTQQRRDELLLTESYVTFPAAIFSAAEVAYLGGLNALRGKAVTVVRGDAAEEWLREGEPRIRLRPVADTREGLRSVARGEVFAFVGNLVTTSYYIGQSGLTEIKVAGETPFVYRLSMAVARDQPVLASILQKGLDAIPRSERDAIYHDWISIRYAHETDWGTLFRVLVVTGLLLFIIALWNLSLTREIARRRQAEAALREAKEAAEQANRAKGAFLANISHELRTPLNVVLGFASMLQDSARSSRERGWLEAIHSAGKSLAQLIDDLLDLSRIEAGRMRTRAVATDVRVLLQELEAMFAQRAIDKGLAIEVQVEDAIPPSLLLDQKRVRQILVNLLGNAVKFTEAGRIDLRAGIASDGAGGQRLRLSVEDTGPGIPADQQQRIFETFAQGPELAASDGVGLGLTISRRLAVALGGDIRLCSEPGRGSTFVLELPGLTPLPAGQSTTAFETQGPLSTPRLGPARVLIVDDRADNRALLREFLVDQPLEVLEASSGEEAVAIARSQQPHLMLMDVAMPGVDGLEAARRLKADALTAEIPILAVTAAAGSENQPALGQAFDRVLQKPLSRAELLAALGRWLADERRSAPQGKVSAVAQPPRTIELSAALHERLLALRPPFASINEIVRFVEAFHEEAVSGDDPEVRRAARELLAAADRFDLAELTQRLDALQRSSRMASSDNGQPSRRAAPA